MIMLASGETQCPLLAVVIRYVGKVSLLMAPMLASVIV